MAVVLNIVTLPEDDPEFHALVTETVRKLSDGHADGHDARPMMAELVRRLLPVYPSLDVRQQDGLASFERNPLTWYVYRDGSHRFKARDAEPVG